MYTGASKKLQHAHTGNFLRFKQNSCVLSSCSYVVLEREIVICVTRIQIVTLVNESFLQEAKLT